MGRAAVEPSDKEIEAALHLLEAPEQDVFSVLGIQAERIEIAERRLADGRPVPNWVSEESFERVLSPQRAPAGELAGYAMRGLSFAKQLMARIEPELRSVVCDGNKVRHELEEVGKDAKETIMYIASAIIGALIASLPAALAAAAASIAAIIAVILLKRRLNTFCATDSNAGVWLGGPQNS
jgi:hypothetical protein